MCQYSNYSTVSLLCLKYFKISFNSLRFLQNYSRWIGFWFLLFFLLLWLLKDVLSMKSIKINYSEKKNNKKNKKKGFYL